jgi:hypothetical protein
MLFHTPTDQSTTLVRDWNALCFSAIEKEHGEACDRLLNGKAIQTFLERNPTERSTKALRQYFDASYAEIDLSSILYIVAGTEARVRDDANSRLDRRSDSLGRSLARFRDLREERQSLSFKEDILKAWKMYARRQLRPGRDVDACVDAIGGFTEAWEIRHWIAHGRNWKVRRPVLGKAVDNAAKAADNLVAALRRLAELGNIAPFA